MRKSYDFSKAERNPYARRLKKQITIRLDEDMVDWFRDQVTKVGAAKVYLGSEADGQNWLDSA